MYRTLARFSIQCREIGVPFIFMGKSLSQLKEDRYHLTYVVDNVELSVRAQTIFEALLQQIEEQIAAAEKPN